MTGASDAPIQADDDVAETRIRPCQRSQPLQSLAPDLQGTTLRRVGGVADPRELSRHISRQRSIMWRAVRVTDSTRRRDARRRGCRARYRLSADTARRAATGQWHAR